MEMKEVLDRNGFHIINNFSLTNPDKDFKTFVSEFAKPISYFGQPLIMDMKPKRNFQSASYAGTGYFDLHTDLTFAPNPPKYIAMLCLSSDKIGGKSLLSDGRKIIQELSEEDLTYLENTSIDFPTPNHVK